METITKTQNKIVNESKLLLQNAKHWLCWLEQKEKLTKEDKGEMNVLKWIVINMEETEKANK